MGYSKKAGEGSDLDEQGRMTPEQRAGIAQYRAENPERFEGLSPLPPAAPAEGSGVPAPQEVAAGPSPEEVERILDGDIVSDVEDGEEVVRTADAQGGTAEVRGAPGFRSRLRRGGGSGGVTVASSEGLNARARADAQLRVNEAAREALAQGDLERAEALLSSPEERERRRINRLRRQATFTRGLNQSVGSLLRERMRRQGAVRQLSAIQDQREQAADLADSAADRASRERIALMEEQGRNERAGLGELRAREEAFQERLDRDFTGPDGEIDYGGRNLMEAFAQRTGVENMTPGRYREARDFVELASSLDEVAEDASRDSWTYRIATGLSALVTGGATLLAGARLRNRPLLRHGVRTLGAGGTALLGLESASSGGEEYPLVETPEELFGFIDRLREAGVGERWGTNRGDLDITGPNRTVEWRGETINLNELDPRLRQRLGRLVRLAPSAQG